MGNRDPEAAPHGCYRCKDGRYIVLACFTEKQWDGFKAALGRPDWCDLERMRRKWQRLNEQKEIDRHIQAWLDAYTVDPARGLDPEDAVSPEGQPLKFYTTGEVWRHFQSFGVPCGVVQNAEELHSDPQLSHRGHYWKLEHPTMGLRTYDGPSFRLSLTPGELTKAAPLLGEDNEYVFKQIVGL